MFMCMGANSFRFYKKKDRGSGRRSGQRHGLAGHLYMTFVKFVKCLYIFEINSFEQN